MTQETEKKKPGKAGRPKGTTQSPRRIGAHRLRRLLKSREPLADESIIIASEIMNDESQTGATRLKAAIHLLQKYTEITGEVYFEQLPKDDKESKGGSKDSDGDEEDQEEEKDGRLAFFSRESK